MTQDDNKIVRLSIATSENWKDKNSGERKEKTEWHRVVIFSPGLANISEKYLKKGSRVYIEGQLQTRKFNDQAGVEKYTTEVVLNFNSSLTMLDTKSEQDSELINSSFPENSEKKVLQEKKNQPENFDIEDEVPF